ncbi:MAG: hypothetical protein HYR68_06680 [Burkholderiales bacterium]|nr:hypothetical protein [Burkholderiales bacterium]
MQAIQILKQAGPEILRAKVDVMPIPNYSEVLVRIDFAGINHADAYQRNGQNPAGLPCVSGADTPGVIPDGTTLFCLRPR